MRSLDLEVFTRALDLLAVAATHDPERTTDPRVDLRADGVPGPAREQKRPRLGCIEPGIKEALGRRFDFTTEAHAEGTQCGAYGALGSARGVHDPISLQIRPPESYNALRTGFVRN
jgi:hypothetical protein